MTTEVRTTEGARRGSPAIFAAALGASLAFVILVFGVFTLLLRVGEGPLRPAVDNYFTKFNSADFAGIYANAAKPLTEETSEDKFVAAQQLIHDKLGNMQSKTIRGISVVSERGPASTVITYDAQFANGPATVALAFQGTGEEGKLVRADFRSDLLPRPERGRRGRG
jgi:hypothetical protein